jgi:hypothetical protein
MVLAVSGYALSGSKRHPALARACSGYLHCWDLRTEQMLSIPIVFPGEQGINSGRKDRKRQTDGLRARLFLVGADSGQAQESG